MDNNNVFLEEFSRRLEEGDFNKYLTMPFMTKNLLFSTAKGRIDRRLEKGGTPVLTELEIAAVIEEAREAAAGTFQLLLETGILEKTTEGYQLSRKGQIAVKLS